MYLWVVLTTFLAMIAAYFLPIRADSQNLVIVPVAQAKMMQMAVKHKAGERYLKERSYPYFSTEAERKVNYTSGRIDNLADFDDTLTHGFVNNMDYVTVIYCMPEDMGSIKSGADACQKSEINKTKRILITFGAIPERWQTVLVAGSDYDIKPSPDMIGALREQFGATEMVGYVVSEGSKLYVVNYENEKFEIPTVIANDHAVAGGYGIRDCLSDYKTCLAYMSKL